MSYAITAAGETLIAQLFADGAPLVVDRFLFAYIEGQDHTAPIDTGVGVPRDKIVHEATIPDEYRAFINPNQVVYSALLGSDVGDFDLNWQGLYCSEHDVLVAVSTFPTLKSRVYDEATNTPGNNVTRNFMLEFTGAQRLTGITIEAKVWQLDFTVRLKGIDERERLSNRDIYGRAAFLEDGWKLVREEDFSGTRYFLLPGVGYVEGIRVALPEKLEVFPPFSPCDVWLDVCMEPEGSDVTAKARILFLAEGGTRADYVTDAPYRIPHYLEKIAHIGEGLESTRPFTGQTFFGLGLAPDGCLQVSRAENGDAITDTRRYWCLSVLPALSEFTVNDSGELLLRLPS